MGTRGQIIFLLTTMIVTLAGEAFVTTAAKAQDGAEDRTPPHHHKNKKAKSKDKDKDASAAAKDGAEPTAPAPHDSAFNRKNKKVVILGEIGLVNLLNAGYGAEVGYYLTPNRVLEADFLQSSFAFLGTESKINLATARFKWFLNNSFYLQFGAGIRQMEAIDDSSYFSTAFNLESYSSKFSAVHGIAEVGLGNRWQFSSFTIGCDWVGYVVPLAKLSSSESFSGAVSDDQKTKDRSNFEKEAGAGNLLLLRLHLGMSF